MSTRTISFLSRCVLIFLWNFLTNVKAWTPLCSAKLRVKSTRFASDASCSTYNDVIIISPPGGVGEVAAVKAAELGNSVRWFLVTLNNDENKVILSKELLDRVKLAGGSLEIAGATAKSLLIGRDEVGSSIKAVSAWCGASSCLVVSTDGIVDTRKKKDEDDPTIAWKNAMKLAAKEASASVTGAKIAILATFDEDESTTNENEFNKVIGFSDIVSGLVGGPKTDIPVSITSALGEANLIRLRHGQLFGTPESSPDFSPLVGGLRRQIELCPEYSFSSVRVDPKISLSGNRMTGTRSSRHAVGEAAALLASGQLQISSNQKWDVCISSQPGTGRTTLGDWKSEFERVENLMKSGQVALLFETEFASVPDTKRLADWLETKWAPAVLRTYDIAAIRTGARPVYANRVSGVDATLEIIWQQLVNFDSVIAGRMIIQVTDTGIKAIRGSGDSKSGFGSISSKPLQGEDVLIRRLSEACSQAVEKGLALKVWIINGFWSLIRL